MQYQKHTYDLKLQEHHYEVGDFVFHCNKASKVGSSRKLNPVWIGPLLITEVINPVLYQVRDRKQEYTLHHDLLKRCEDRTIPFWLRKMRHNLMDLDTTIAYDASEQDSEPAVEPPVPVASSVSDGAQDLLEPPVSVAPSVPDGALDLLAQSTSTVDADISQAGADVIAPANQSFISSGADAPEEVIWMDKSGDWG